MIKLVLSPKPHQLTAKVEKELTDEFKMKGTAVWKKLYIKDALLNMSHSKCAYSEVKLNERSSFMEVEHFKNKNQYPDDVVKWGNLLPACKFCNDKKDDWDVVADPIVNPVVDTPKDHLYIQAFRYYGRDKMGENTIKAVGINNRNQFEKIRSEIAFEKADSVEKILDNLAAADTNRKRHNAVIDTKQLLQECGPENEFSSVISTFILYECDSFRKLKFKLQQFGLWDDELQSFENNMIEIAMPLRSGN